VRAIMKMPSTAKTYLGSRVYVCKRDGEFEHCDGANVKVKLKEDERETQDEPHASIYLHERS
jgi:hypothetical protein